jgi:hypothetical protein
MGIRRMRDAKMWIYAFHEFQSRNESDFPTNFDQVVPYLGKALESDRNPDEPLRDRDDFLQSTNQFEITYQGKLNAFTNWNSAIVMREKEAWPNPSGGWNRTYGFADGHTEVHRSTDGNFEPWEQQHTPRLKPEDQ